MTCKQMIISYCTDNVCRGGHSVKKMLAGLEGQFKYTNAAVIKRCLKQMLSDNVLVNVKGRGIGGSMKLTADELKKSRSVIQCRAKAVVKAAKKKSAIQNKKEQRIAKAQPVRKPKQKVVKRRSQATPKPRRSATPKPIRRKPKNNIVRPDLPKTGFIDQRLYDQLDQIGATKYLIEDFDEGFIGNHGTGNCILSALSRNIYTVNAKNGRSELKKVMFSAPCPRECGATLDVTLQDLLEQNDFGLDGTGPIKCARCCDYCVDSQERCLCFDAFGFYVNRICCGTPQFDCDFYTNHCMDCPGLGMCVGDVRLKHCVICGNHYFHRWDKFKCEKCAYGGW